jgi:hypothetical protein
MHDPVRRHSEGDAGIPMNLPIYNIVEGRRPEGLTMPSAKEGSVLGSYLAQAAYLDAASALAFERLARELAAHGAPDALVTACEQAHVTELRHAAKLGRLAGAFGVEAAMPERTPLGVRPLLDVAIENAVEGVVRQTYGAAAARFRARTAGDADIRRVMETIAADEHEHAELAFEIAAWLHGVLDPIEQVLVEDTTRHAARTLARELDVEPDAELRTAIGVPTRLDALTIWRGLSHRVWHGLSERVWSGVWQAPVSGVRTTPPPAPAESATGETAAAA